VTIANRCRWLSVDNPQKTMSRAQSGDGDDGDAADQTAKTCKALRSRRDARRDGPDAVDVDAGVTAGRDRQSKPLIVQPP
jgi:hypothetical protein